MYEQLPDALHARLNHRGRRIVVRPIRDDDLARHRRFAACISPQDLYRRFFSFRRELPEAQLVRFTHIDYQREMAFVATALDGAGAEETLGVVARLRRCRRGGCRGCRAGALGSEGAGTRTAADAEADRLLRPARHAPAVDERAERQSAHAAAGGIARFQAGAQRVQHRAAVPGVAGTAGGSRLTVTNWRLAVARRIGPRGVYKVAAGTDFASLPAASSPIARSVARHCGFLRPLRS